jgi:Leucine-rich repeat (LRR) protein
MLRSVAFLFAKAALLLMVLAPRSSFGDQCDCPQNCVCSTSSKNVVCNNLQTFPKLCNGTEFVTIRNSAIEILSEKDELPTSVRHLIVQRSQTKSIVEGFFPNGSELAILSLDNNDISEANWFTNIPKLANLDLSSNHISKLERIPSTIQLTNLKLNGNKMHHSDVSSALCKMDSSRLRNLHLDGMQLTAFPQGIISCKDKTKTVHPLSFLSLSNNRMTKIPQMAYMKVNQLYLASNKIRDIPGNTLPLSLTYLVLANNPLSNKGLAAIAWLTNLKHLDLAGVDYKHFPSDMFHFMSKLEYLSLMRCNITKIETPMNMLVNLKSLCLQSNRLRQIPVKELSPVVKLENLFLNHNLISFIEQTDKTEELLYHLKKLGISRNPFYCGCPILWFSKWLRYQYRVTEIVNLKETQCGRPFKGLELGSLGLSGCDKGKMHLEITLVTVASMIIVGAIIGALLCCCRQRSNDDLKSSIKAKGAKGYHAI